MDVCPNCSTELKGRFCYSCGQKVIESKERTLKHFIYQFFGSAFFLENNFMKNVWTLAVKPGRLPLDFIEGRRKRWMPPFSLFLLINLFYFWYSPLSDLNLTLHEQERQFHHAGWAERMVNSRLEQRGISFDEYAEVYNQKSTGYSNSLIVLHLPIFAAFLSLFYIRKKYFFADHFIFSLYYFAFVLLVGLIQSGLLYVFIVWLGLDRSVFGILKVAFAVVVPPYTFFALRKTYALKIGWALAGVVPVVLALLVTHFVYRTILFLIIFAVT
jgi:hypothetical protein